MVNVSTSLINLKTKVDDVDVGKLKTLPVYYKKLIGVLDNEVNKNTKFRDYWCNYLNSHNKQKSIQHR